MTLTILIVLAMLGKEPPEWHETLYLDQPLLPGTATELAATEDFTVAAIDLANRAGLDRTSDMNAAIVHQNYRQTLLSEHIFIRPDDKLKRLELRDNHVAVLWMAVGFTRRPNSFNCKFNGLFLVDNKGVIHEYIQIPANQTAAFERKLERWMKQRVQAVHVARERARRNEKP